MDPGRPRAMIPQGQYPSIGTSHKHKNPYAISRSYRPPRSRSDSSPSPPPEKESGTGTDRAHTPLGSNSGSKERNRRWSSTVRAGPTGLANKTTITSTLYTGGSNLVPRGRRRSTQITDSVSSRPQFRRSIGTGNGTSTQADQSMNMGDPDEDDDSSGPEGYINEGTGMFISENPLHMISPQLQNTIGLPGVENSSGLSDHTERIASREDTPKHMFSDEDVSPDTPFTRQIGQRRVADSSLAGKSFPRVDAVQSHTWWYFRVESPQMTGPNNGHQRTMLPILPRYIHTNGLGRIRLTRRRGERALLMGSVIWLVYKLLSIDEAQVALELFIIMGLTIAYLHFRPYRNSQDKDHSASTRKFGSTREHVSTSHTLPARPNSQSDSEPEPTCTGSQGFVWATEARDYRSCMDDGAAWALLLGPILSGAMFYETCRRLQHAISNHHSVSWDDVLAGWQIERPLVLSSTPLIYPSMARPSSGSEFDQAFSALSALALSRRQLCHLMCLLSLLLLGHTLWSRRREIRKSPRNNQDCGKLGWSSQSEWKRTGAVMIISITLTAGFVGLKIVAQVMDLTYGYDFTYSDLVISTLFFQFCMYVCVRLARRGFTLGELGVICHAGTGLFMETVNLTRMKISIFKTPFIRTYRLPTPLLTFQLALIPGSFLCGFLLSPLLVLSRKIAQRPVHRLRHPEEKLLYRQGLAAGFYAGAALICGGLIGFWAKWCLGGRNPWVWIVLWMTEGKKMWTRPFLIAYWGLLASISVGGWTRQLHRARKRKAYAESKVANGKRKVSVVPPTAHTLTTVGVDKKNGTYTSKISPPLRTPSPFDGKSSGFGDVASHMMDEMDHRLPVLTKNARRKFFHALAVVMFVPGIIVDPAFTHLSFSLAFALFNFAEYIRYFALYPFGAAVHLFLNEFLDEKDSGTAILSHFYLLTGCAGGLWLDSPKTILSLVGVFSLGIGDALASIVGKKFGRVRWSTSSGKTIEGSLAFFASVLLAGVSVRLTGLAEDFSLGRYALLALAMSVMEALSEQNDNLILPIWSWCLGVMMDV